MAVAVSAGLASLGAASAALAQRIAYDDFSVPSPAGTKVGGRTAVTGQVWSVSVNAAVVDTARGAATHPGGYGGGYAFLDLPTLPTHYRMTFELDAAGSSIVLAAGMIGITDFLHPQVSPTSVNWLASVKGVGSLVNIFGSGNYWTWPALTPGVTYTFEYWLNHEGNPQAMRVRDPTGAERTLYSEHLPALMAGARGLTIQPTNTFAFVRTVEAGKPPAGTVLLAPTGLRVVP